MSRVSSPSLGDFSLSSEQTNIEIEILLRSVPALRAFILKPSPISCQILLLARILSALHQPSPPCVPTTRTPNVATSDAAFNESQSDRRDVMLYSALARFDPLCQLGLMVDPQRSADVSRLDDWQVAEGGSEAEAGLRD